MNRHKTLWVKGINFKRFDIMADGYIILVSGDNGKISYKVIGRK